MMPSTSPALARAALTRGSKMPGAAAPMPFKASTAPVVAPRMVSTMSSLSRPDAVAISSNEPPAPFTIDAKALLPSAPRPPIDLRTLSTPPCVMRSISSH